MSKSFTISTCPALAAAWRASDLFTSIPSFATAPALIFVGFLMFEAVVEIKFTEENLTEAIPAYLCILAMPLFYSISEGIAMGVISYVAINLISGKVKEKKLSKEQMESVERFNKLAGIS